MTTRLTVTSTEEEGKLQAFRDFKVGEFLLVPGNKAVGIKVDDTHIKFIREYDGKMGTTGLSSCIPADYPYLVPAAVDIKVTR